MHNLRSGLCALAIMAGLVAIHPVDAAKIGSDASRDELSWRDGYHQGYYNRGYYNREGYRYYGQYPSERYYRQRPVIYRSYYYQRPFYYPAPYYYDPYYPNSGAYLYFRM